MLLKNIAAIILVFSFALVACKDESEITAPIVGKWNGQEADFKINPSGIIPPFTLHQDEFPVQLEFKRDGTLILTDSKVVSRNGTYTQSANQLTINIDYTFELIELSGTYQINQLTSSSLQAEIEKEGTYTHPDSGQDFDGKVIAMLYFTKSPN